MMEALSSRGIQIIAVGRSEMRSTAFSFLGYSFAALPRKTSPRIFYFVLGHSDENMKLARRDMGVIFCSYYA